jgi:urease accessory protein
MDLMAEAQSLLRAQSWSGTVVDNVRLDYEGRFLRRKRLTTVRGFSFLVNLPETVSINQGDAFRLLDGRLIEVMADDEPLIEIRGALTRLAWHIGNRHTPCQIGADHLLIRQDHVLEAMLRQLGAGIRPVFAPFIPEGGAYGHGRTMGHDHGPGPHSHAPVQGDGPALSLSGAASGATSGAASGAAVPIFARHPDHNR